MGGLEYFIEEVRGAVSDYWVPKRKYELVDALVKKYGDGERSKLRRMPMRQLLAIWHKLWRKDEAEAKS